VPALNRQIYHIHVIDWAHNSKMCLFKPHEAFLRKSKQIAFPEADFCAEYEYLLVCECAICLIRSLIKVKGQLVQKTDFDKIYCISSHQYKSARIV
jgi:hypothetical protein